MNGKLEQMAKLEKLRDEKTAKWLEHYLNEDDISNSDCDFLDSDTESSVDSPTFEQRDLTSGRLYYHIRITGEREPLLELVKQYTAHYNVFKYIFSYEEVDDNHHIHGHIEYAKEPTKQSISQWMKTKGYSGKYYHKKLDKDPKSNILYVVKDLDLIHHNLSKEHIDFYKNETKKITENKKLEQRHKLLLEYNKYLETVQASKNFWTLPDLARWIMNHYINVYDKEPPLAHLKGYTIYIASKCTEHFHYRPHLDNLFTNLF